jgi:protein-lysine N-methyltransferase EEF2KMT
MSLQSVRITSASNVPPAPSYVSYIYKSPHSPDSSIRCITLYESQKVIESGTTGLRTWSASLALAHWILHHPGTTNNFLQTLLYLYFYSIGEVRGQNVLELGSGAGFLGITVALLQLEHKGNIGGSGGLCLTDVDESVLQQCHRNLHLTPSESFKRP